MRRMKRALVAIVGMLLVSGAAAVANAPDALADGHGCSSYSNIMGVPTGVLCINVYGSGHTITNENANWSAVNACNWRIDFTYYDNNNHLYYRNTGPTHLGCTNAYGSRTNITGNAAYGRACAELWQAGVKIDGACVYITP